MGSSLETSVVVGVGDGRLAKPPSEYIVTFALGSCVAVIWHDWRFKIGGLVHVMLPDSRMDRERANGNPYVYADTGLPAMFNRLTREGSTKRTLRCCIAGGASMLEHSAHFEIGKKNLIAVKRALWQLGVLIDAEDVAGSVSRSVRLDLRTGQVDMKCGGDRNRV
jgi:chemotaxis protein CheD